MLLIVSSQYAAMKRSIVICRGVAILYEHVILMRIECVCHLVGPDGIPSFLFRFVYKWSCSACAMWYSDY